MKSNINIEAIRLLQSKATEVAKSGNGLESASKGLTTLHNAVFYLLTGRGSTEAPVLARFHRNSAA